MSGPGMDTCQDREKSCARIPTLQEAKIKFENLIKEITGARPTVTINFHSSENQFELESAVKLAIMIGKPTNTPVIIHCDEDSMWLNVGPNITVFM